MLCVRVCICVCVCACACVNPLSPVPAARLRKPQDGLFTGVIDALDTVNNTYRITFDRPGLGTHSIPDSEVLVSTLLPYPTGCTQAEGRAVLRDTNSSFRDLCLWWCGK